jgi:hypothetical protein
MQAIENCGQVPAKRTLPAGGTPRSTRGGAAKCVGQASGHGCRDPFAGRIETADSTMITTDVRRPSQLGTVAGASFSVLRSELVYAQDTVGYLAEIGWLPIADRTAEELQERAAELRRMAETATTRDVMEALLRLADRYDAAAKRRER